MSVLAFLFLGLLPRVASADFKGKSQVEINEVVSSRRFFFSEPPEGVEPIYVTLAAVFFLFVFCFWKKKMLRESVYLDVRT